MASYSEVAVSGYNSSPPIDNGTVTGTNKILWATIKTKLSDPVKTAMDSINDNIATADATVTSNLATATANLAVVQASYTAATSVLNAPATTACMFKQTSAPIGWTKSATHNNKAIRLVSGTVSTGGSTAFTSVFTSRTITSSNLPTHTHTWSTGSISINFSNETGLWTDADINNNDVANGGSTLSNGINTSTTTVSGSGSVSGNTSSTGSGTAMDFAVRYVDLIIATKDA